VWPTLQLPSLLPWLILSLLPLTIAAAVHMWMRLWFQAWEETAGASLEHSRLVTTLGQVLADKAALNAFAKYITKQHAGLHFKFWRSAEQLKRTAQRMSDSGETEI